MQDNDDLRFRLHPLRPRSRQRPRKAERQPSRTLPIPGLPPIPYLTCEHPLDPADESLAGFDGPAFHKAGIRLAMELKALVGRRGVVIYNGGPHDRSWPLQLDLLIDWPPT